MEALLSFFVMLFGDYLATIPGIVTLTLVISEFVSKKYPLDGFKAQIGSWVVAIALSTIGAFLNIGVFAEEGSLVWYLEGPTTGFLIGLAANGLFQVPQVTTVLEKMKVRPRK